MIGIPLGLLASNAVEWAFHRYVLHGLGRRKGSFFAYHLVEHHKAAREHGMRDGAYRKPFWASQARTKEVLMLAAGALAVLPLFPVAPFFVGAAVYSTANYYRMHRRAHLDPAWARKNLPWHYAHHLGNQNRNWCVTHPWFDRIVGTDAPLRGIYPRPPRTLRLVPQAATSTALH